MSRLHPNLPMALMPLMTTAAARSLQPRSQGWPVSSRECADGHAAVRTRAQTSADDLPDSGDSRMQR